MNSDQLNILIVEDEAILALNLKTKLQREGYHVVGTAATGKRALELFTRHTADLVLCDIHLKGDLDGIETGRQLLAQRPVPLIYLTAFSDRATLDRAAQNAPAAYLVKPINVAQLRTAIDLAVSNFARLMSGSPNRTEAAEPQPERDFSRDTILRIDNQIFVKSSQHFVRIDLTDVLYLEADDVYTTLVTTKKKYTLRRSLSQVLERIDYNWFVRVHRSYAVNLEHVDAFADGEVCIQTRQIPLGRSYREAFIRRFTFH